MKSQSHEIGSLNHSITFKFDRQHFCQGACQISKWLVNPEHKSRDFESLQDLTIRHLIRYWNGAQVSWQSIHLLIGLPALTHWGWVTHICVNKPTTIGSDNGLSPGRRQAIIWTNAGILLIGPLGTNFCEILIEIYKFSFKKMHLKMSSGKWRPFCLGLNVLRPIQYLQLPCGEFNLSTLAWAQPARMSNTNIGRQLCF